MAVIMLIKPLSQENEIADLRRILDSVRGGRWRSRPRHYLLRRDYCTGPVTLTGGVEPPYRLPREGRRGLLSQQQGRGQDAL